MTEIDWNAPLEAYHPDGRVVEVLGGYRGYRQNIHPDPQIDGGRNYMFSGDGNHFASEWRIRNRTTKPANAPSPELVERMVAYCRIRAFDGDREAKEIMSELEPKPDADEVLRDEICAEYGIEFLKSKEGVLAAIKRVRAEKG